MRQVVRSFDKLCTCKEVKINYTNLLDLALRGSRKQIAERQQTHKKRRRENVIALIILDKDHQHQNKQQILYSCF